MRRNELVEKLQQKSRRSKTGGLKVAGTLRVPSAEAL
jgi:hypothetical protein